MFNGRTSAVGARVDFMSLLAEPERKWILKGSTDAHYPAGSGGNVRVWKDDFAALIKWGLVRTYVTAASGRQATVHYIHAGELLSSGIVAPPSIRVHVQSVTDIDVTNLDIEQFRNASKTDLHVSNALSTYLTGLEANSIRIIAVRSLGRIVERLAFDLLDRACINQLATGTLVVHATQQQLADSIGSAREVVARSLRHLRTQGIVVTAQHFVRVLDVMRLEDIVSRAVI
jgi:CRP/FNR family transcriptional regulator